MRTLISVILLVCAAEAHADTAALREQAESFAGLPISLDPRLPVPPCPNRMALDWRGNARTSLLAHCAATGWAMVIPVGAAGRAATGRAQAIVRRGQPVHVLASGNGFRVMVEGVAERDGRTGERVVVRNMRSGRRMAVDIGPDGGMMLATRAEDPMDRP